MSGGGVPIGAYVDFPADSPVQITTGSQTYLRSGVTNPSTFYPKVPASLVGNINNILTEKNMPMPTAVAADTTYGSQLVTDGAGTVIYLSTSLTSPSTIMVSTDNGTTFTPRQLPGLSTDLAVGWVVHVVYDGSKFCVLCQQNSGANKSAFILSSATPALGNWLVSELPQNINGQGFGTLALSNFKYVNGAYYIFGATAGFFRSTDMNLWTLISLSTTNPTRDIVWTGTKYVVYAGVAAYTALNAVAACVFTSTTGTGSWSAGIDPSGGLLLSISSMYIVGSNVYIVANYYNNGYASYVTNAVYVSSNHGATWAQMGGGYVASYQPIGIFGFGGSTYVIARPTSTTVSVQKSTDGLTGWTTVTSDALTFSTNGFRLTSTLSMKDSAIVVSNGIMLMMVTSNTASLITIAYSTNGTAWSFANQRINTSAASMEITSICHNSTGTVTLASLGVGYTNPGGDSPWSTDATRQSNCYLYSTDQQNWNMKLMPVVGNWQSVYHDGTRFWMCATVSGNLSTLASSVVYKSTDGLTGWTAATTPAGMYVERIMSLNGGATTVALGYNTNKYLMTAISTDAGSTWTVGGYIDAGVVRTWRSVASNGIRLASATYNTGIIYSDDGLNWTVAPNPAGYTTFYTICSDGIGFYTATHLQYPIMYSADCAKWEMRGVPDMTRSTDVINDMGYDATTNQLVFVIGATANTYIYRSSDYGMNWSASSTQFIPGAGRHILTSFNKLIASSYVYPGATGYTSRSFSVLYSGLFGSYVKNSVFAKGNAEGTAVKYMRVA